jgi:cytochrome c-type biogenesis protein CcmH
VKLSVSILGAGLLAACLQAAWAIDSQPPFADAVTQSRYEQLIHEFRCLVCQNETVADSNANLAGDFRRQIHAMVAAGESDQQIRDYMVARYGDFILYKPPVQSSTWLLWGGPFLVLAIALIAASRIIKRRAGMDDQNDERAGQGGA